jgi:hypothetical protein
MPDAFWITPEIKHSPNNNYISFNSVIHSIGEATGQQSVKAQNLEVNTGK